MAATQLPVLLTPRSATPNSNDSDSPPHTYPSGNPAGLGFEYDSSASDHDGASDGNAAPLAGGRGLLSPSSASSLNSSVGFSPQSLYSPITPQTASTDGGFQSITAAQDGRNPFNFTTQQYVAGRTLRQPNSSEALGKRRGHKYRHSSIHTSHQIFQAPVQKAPLSVPASLPMPTRKEAWGSFTSHQTLRMVWCFCHFLVAGYVQFSAGGSLAMMALSRLLLFDAAGAAVSVLVDVMGNFEVWKRSSIKHPFGLERADVLAGFGLAVFIGFMGLDIISHGIQHSLENLGHHEAHHSHSHRKVSPGSVDVASLVDSALAIGSTLVSAILLKNHARIGKAMRVHLLPVSWGRVLSNPSHLLTLSTSILLLILPLLSTHFYTFFDTTLGFVIAGLMIAFGVRLGMALASMLLMSYNPPNDKDAVREVISQMEGDPGISAVEEANFWQVHYGLCMANIKLRYWPSGGYGDEVLKIRQRITSLIRSRLGGGYGSGNAGTRWDVSIQLSVERD